MRPRPPAPLKPVCTCGHGYGHHENGLACRHVDEAVDVWWENSVKKFRDEACRCVRYDGPDPAIFGLETTT